MNHQVLLDHFQNQQSTLLDSIRELVIHETPSHDKPRLDTFANLLRERFLAVGASVELIESEKSGNHLVARFVAAQQATGANHAKPALILCHYDTVWPVGTLERLPFRIENGRAYGPGIFDMQSSLALSEAALAAVNALQLRLPRPVTVLITSDEEVGSPTSRELIEKEAQRSEYVLVMESPLPGGVLKTTRKGIGGFRLEIKGAAAHAGVDPDKGASAIRELAQQITKLYSLADREKETTVNVGVISGGTAANVIAANASAQIDIRTWSKEEADRISQALAQLKPSNPGCTLRLSGGWNRPPMERRMTGALFERVCTVAAKLGMTLKEGGTGGGSDGNFTAAMGIPTIDGLGVPGAGAHADHEHIEIDQIAGRAALLTALLAEL